MNCGVIRRHWLRDNILLIITLWLLKIRQDSIFMQSTTHLQTQDQNRNRMVKTEGIQWRTNGTETPSASWNKLIMLVGSIIDLNSLTVVLAQKINWFIVKRGFGGWYETGTFLFFLFFFLVRRPFWLEPYFFKTLLLWKRLRSRTGSREPGAFDIVEFFVGAKRYDARLKHKEWQSVNYVGALWLFLCVKKGENVRQSCLLLKSEKDWTKIL